MLIKAHYHYAGVCAGALALLSLAAFSVHVAPGDLSARIAARFYLDTLLDLSGSASVLNVSFLSRLGQQLSDGKFPAEFPVLRIDVKLKHFKKIQQDRCNAVELGILHKPTTVPAGIQFDGRTYKAKIRLKGDLGAHWQWPNRWSFRVRLKDGKTIEGFNQLSLQRPPARQFPYDQLFHV